MLLFGQIWDRFEQNLRVLRRLQLHVQKTPIEKKTGEPTTHQPFQSLQIEDHTKPERSPEQAEENQQRRERTVELQEIPETFFG